MVRSEELEMTTSDHQDLCATAILATTDTAESTDGSFHVKSSDFWPFFHGPPPILLKFGTLVEIV